MYLSIYIGYVYIHTYADVYIHTNVAAYLCSESYRCTSPSSLEDLINKNTNMGGLFG